MINTTAKQSARVPQTQREQGGYLLVELALVLIVSTILMTSQFSQMTRGLQEALAKSTGQYAVELQSAVNKYIAEHSAALKSGAPIVGFAVPLKPTTDELIAADFTADGFSPTSPLGMAFATELVQIGCPAKCEFTGVSYAKTPYTVEGVLRNDILVVAVKEMGLHGRVSRSETPSILSGTVETSANPLGAVAGILAIRVGAGTDTNMDAYYRVDGSKALTGPMDAGGQAIGNVSTLTTNLINTQASRISGTATPGAACLPAEQGEVRRNVNGTGLVVCFNNAWQMVGNVVPGIADGAACTNAGQVGASATGVSFLCNGAVWEAANKTSTAGTACAPNGRMASTVSREQLVCRNGQYVLLSSVLSKNVEVSRLLVRDLDNVAKPTCSVGGTPAYSINLQQTVVDVSVSPPRQALAVVATDTGTHWAISITLKTNTGSSYSGNSYNVTAVMKLECAY